MNALRRSARCILAGTLSLLIAWLVAACAPTSPPEPYWEYQPISPPAAMLSGPLIGRRWHVESIRIPGVSNLARPAMPAWLEFTPTGTLQFGTGYGDFNNGDCYPHAFAIEYDEGKNTFRLFNVFEVPATECSNQFFQGLVSDAIGNQWSIENERLALTGVSGTVMMLTLEAPQ